MLANDTNPPGSGPLSVGSKTDGSNGAVAITNGGADVSYTPDADFCGQDTFTYSLSAGGSTATVTVDVPCPTAVDDAFDANTCGGAAGLQPIMGTFDAFRLDVLPNDTNPPGSGSITIASITQPTVNGSPQGSASIIESGGAIRLNTTGSAGDTYVLTYQLSPGGSQATVSTTVICDEGS